jgi:uncharacterized protein
VGKLLFWIVIIIGVLFVARIAGRMAAARQDGPAGASPPGKTGQPAARGGIHPPRSEALLQGGQTWCSQEHARLGPATK